jgi:hypothetical protein
VLVVRRGQQYKSLVETTLHYVLPQVSTTRLRHVPGTPGLHTMEGHNTAAYWRNKWYPRVSTDAARP